MKYPNWLARISFSLSLLMIGYYLAWLPEVNISDTQNFHHVGLYNPLFSNSFLAIFVNNVVVGIIASVGGFLTAGTLTIAVFIWNGFLLGVVVRGVYELGVPTDVIIEKIVYHGAVEIFAFLIFGLIGLSGWDFYKHILTQENFPSQPIKPIFIKFVLANFLLFIAALIESSLMNT